MATLNEMKERIDEALSYAGSGSVDGAHHKMWVIDQMIRALTGCPQVKVEVKGKKGGADYTYTKQGESKEYLAWVKEFEGPVDANGDKQYGDWDVGIPP